MQRVGVALAGGDAVGDVDPLEAVDGGPRQLVDHPLHPGHGAAGGRLGQQDRELVAADAEALVGGPGGPDRRGDGAEDLVPGRVAESVVDALEAVEIEQAERQRMPVAARAGELVTKPLLVGAAVGQVGERRGGCREPLRRAAPRARCGPRSGRSAAPVPAVAGLEVVRLVVADG